MKLDLRVVVMAFGLLLVGCGGGGSLEKNSSPVGGGGGNPPQQQLTIQLALADTAGNPVTEVSLEQPLVLSAQLSGADDIANKVISFSMDIANLATFDNDTATAQTDSTGLATIGLKVATLQGSGIVTATTKAADDSDVTATIGFSSAGNGVVETAEVHEIDVIASSLRMPSDGSEVVDVVAIVKDDKFKLLSNVEVSFAVSSGEFKVINAITDDNGQAKAQVSTRVDKPNRIILVSAQAGTMTSEPIAIEVHGTQIQVNAASNMVKDQTAEITVDLQDASGAGIGGERVRIVSNNQVTDIQGNALPSATGGNPGVTAITDGNGQIFVRYTASNFGEDNISVFAYENTSISNTPENPDTEGQAVATTRLVTVQADAFEMQVAAVNGQTCDPSSECSSTIKLTESAELQLNWTESGSPVTGVEVQLATTRGVISGGTPLVTNDAGVVSFDLSSDNAGPAVITASATRTEQGEQISVSTQLALEFVASDADSIVLQAGKSSLAAAGDQTSLIATVRDPKGNLVKGKTVLFEIVTDSGNGELFPASSITNSSGIAASTYTSNGVTGLNGVTIRAKVEGEEEVNGSVSLTVADQELFIVVGTGNEIEQQVGIFSKPFRVFVTDVDSNPVASKQLQVSAVPLHATRGHAYRKGVWTARYDGSNFKFWEPTYPLSVDNSQGYPIFSDPVDGELRVSVNCYNEDHNINGILDIDVDGNNLNEAENNSSYASNDGIPQFSEDYNGDGKLNPGNVVSVVGNLITDANGMAEFSLQYPQNFAPWVDVNIVVSGAVGGTESSAEMVYRLGYSSSYVLNEFSPPPANPFGNSNSCASF